MMNKREFAIVVALIALSWITTVVIRIPIPATTGYFNIGDVFIIFGALWLGPVRGMLIGLIGPTIADAMGYPQFILATAVTKGLEGLIVGLVAGSGPSRGRKLFGAWCGGAVMVLGYFVFEAFIYPAIGRTIPFFAVTNIGAAVAEIIPNSVQAIITVTVAFGLWHCIPRSRGDQLLSENVEEEETERVGSGGKV